MKRELELKARKLLQEQKMQVRLQKENMKKN